MSTSSDQGDSKNNPQTENNEANNSRPIAAKESFRSYLTSSVRKPENLPNYLIAIFTLSLAIFAYLAWRETQRSTEALYRSLQLEHRAALKIVNWSMDKNPLANNRHPIVGFDFVNTGHTAAYMISGTYDYTIAPSLTKSFDIRDHALPGFPAIIAQGETFNFKITNLPVIDASNITDVKDGKSFLYLRLVVLFRDLAGTRYEIRTTGQYSPQIGFQFPELPISNEPQLNACDFAANRKFNTYRRIPCP